MHIPRPEDLSPWRRIIVTIVIVLSVVLILFIISMFSVEGRQPEGQSIIECADPSVRDALKLTIHKSLDRSFEERTIKLFAVWLSDEQDQPRRFLNGMRLSVRGYINARNFVETWNPPPCSEGLK